MIDLKTFVNSLDEKPEEWRPLIFSHSDYLEERGDPLAEAWRWIADQDLSLIVHYNHMLNGHHIWRCEIPLPVENPLSSKNWMEHPSLSSLLSQMASDVMAWMEKGSPLIPQELCSPDWKEAFKYGSPRVCESGHIHGPREAGPGSSLSSPFQREDVNKVIAISEGENDGDSWLGVFRLHYGRFVSLRAWGDYTGWG